MEGERALYVATYPLWVKLPSVVLIGFIWWMFLVEGLPPDLTGSVRGLLSTLVTVWLAVVALPEFWVRRTVFTTTGVRHRSRIGVITEFGYRDIVLNVDPFRRFLDVSVPSKGRVFRVWRVEGDLGHMKRLMAKRGTKIRMADPSAQLRS